MQSQPTTSRRPSRHLVALIGLLCLALGPWSSASAQQSTSNNLLQNPGFEGDFEIQCSFPGGKPWLPVPCNGPLPSMPWQTVRIAKGWVGWWQPPNEDRSSRDFYSTFPNYCGNHAPAGCVAWHQPEFNDTRTIPPDPPRIRSGENSQKYFSFWSVHEGGLYQVVENIRPGTPLRFSVYMMAWSATKLAGIEPNPHTSFGQTNMHMRVGIDPTGGSDPWSPDIVWGSEIESYDKFTRYEVQAVARSNTVTVFTHSRPENPMQHNDVYVDDAELVIVGGVGPSEPLTINPPPAMQAVGPLSITASTKEGRITHIVKPGDTLFALALQYGVPVDQILALNGLTPESQVQVGRELIIALPAPPTRVPAAPAPVATPVVSVGGAGSGRGAVCVQAFNDADADGRWGLGEAPVSAVGIHFAVSDAQGETVGDYVSDGQPAGHCFTDLPATTYRVLAALPIGFAATTRDRWAVSLPSDAQVDIQFGLRAETTSSPSPIGPVAAIGAGSIIVLVLAGVRLWKRRP